MRGPAGPLAALLALHTFSLAASSRRVAAGAVHVNAHQPQQWRSLSLVQIKSTRQRTVVLEEEKDHADAQRVDAVSQIGRTAGKSVPGESVHKKPAPLAIFTEKGAPSTQSSSDVPAAAGPGPEVAGVAASNVTGAIAGLEEVRHRSLSTEANKSEGAGSLPRTHQDAAATAVMSPHEAATSAVQASTPSTQSSRHGVLAAAGPDSSAAGVAASSVAGANKSEAVDSPLRTSQPAPAVAVARPSVAATSAVQADAANHEGRSGLLVEFSQSLPGWTTQTLLMILIFVGVLGCAALIGLSLSQEEPPSAASASPAAGLLSADALTCRGVASRSSPEIRPSGSKHGLPSLNSVQGTLPATSHVPRPASSQVLPDAAEGSLAPATAQVGEDNFFCRDLVVPPNCECVLRVPKQPLGKEGFEVTDMNKNQVLRVEPRSARWREGIPTGYVESEADPCRLVLVTCQGDVLAHCGPAGSGPGSCTTSPRSPQPAQKVKEFHLMKPKGDVFARLVPDESVNQQYVMNIRTGKSLYFCGDFEDMRVSITGEKNKLVARAEMLPPDMPGASVQWYKVHVASLADAGLILCGLFCAQLLSQ